MRRDIHEREGSSEQRHDLPEDRPKRPWREEPPPPRQFALGTREMERIEQEHRDREQQRSSELIQIVHDLKNPIATIALELCLLEASLVAPEVRRRLVRVTQNLAFLDRLVHEILDAGALEESGLHIQRHPTELRTLLECIIDRSTPSRDRARVFLDARTPVVVAIDELRIERVICNLLQNALKYSAVSSGVVVRLDVNDETVRMSVADAGPGLTESEKQLVFERFRRTSTGTSHEGHGLGLYISKQIVEAHGGTIGVESTRGVGSCFYVELPLTQ
jgi:signal transduction histidine kinase